jgi:hypothetical protein
MDIATALDIPLDGEQELKFNALKELHGKKIKSLITSLDIKDKEMAKLRVMGKDNRLAQMVQILKNKLREQELITDVVKEELTKKSDMTADEVSEYIIRKTLGGPKRFRPLTREEMELKINELDKILIKKEKIIKNNISSSSNISLNGNVKGDGSTKASPRPINNNINKNNKSNSLLSSEEITKMANLVDEVSSLKSIIQVKDNLIENHKGEVSRLRSRNAELRIVDEDEKFKEESSREIRESYERLSKELDETTHRLAELMEENMQLRAEQNLDMEQQQLEAEGLQEQCSRLLKQNSSLLQQMAELEIEVERAISESAAIGSTHAHLESNDQRKVETIHTLEQKITRIQAKLTKSEEKNKALQIEVTQVDELKTKLRETNIQYISQLKDMKRVLEEKDAKVRNSTAAANSPVASPIKKSNVQDDKTLLLQAQREIEWLKKEISSIQSQPTTKKLNKRKENINTLPNVEILNLIYSLMDYSTDTLRMSIDSGFAPNLSLPPSQLNQSLERICKLEIGGTQLALKIENFTIFLEGFERAVNGGDDELIIVKEN